MIFFHKEARYGDSRRLFRSLLMGGLLFFFVFPLFPQDTGGDANLTVQKLDEQRRDTLRYGTETEISSLIQTLKTEKNDTLDDELVKLAGTSRNRSILSGIFSFFAEREKGGLEDRAIRVVSDRDDEASGTVLAAMDYLGKLKVSAASDTLQNVIDAEERRYTTAAARALGQVGSADKNSGDEAAAFLVDFYQNRNPAEDQQRELIVAIGETRSSTALPFLKDMARGEDERITLRMAALEALAKIGDPDGLEAVLAAVSGGDPNVRSVAVTALGPFSGPEADAAILEAFRDSFWRTRLAAASAARERKLAAAVPYLRYRAENDETRQVKAEAIRALGAIGGADAEGILSSLFMGRKNSDEVRILAGETLIQNDPARYLPDLITELDDAKKRNQTALYNGILKDLGGAQTPQIEDFTRRLLSSGGVIEKSYALDLCANNAFRSLADEIRSLTDPKNGNLSRKALVTLQKLGISE